MTLFSITHFILCSWGLSLIHFVLGDVQSFDRAANFDEQSYILFFIHVFLFRDISTQRPFCALSPVPSTFSALQGKSEGSPSLSSCTLLGSIAAKAKTVGEPEGDADSCREGWCEVWVRWCLLPMRRRSMNLAKHQCKVLPYDSSLGWEKLIYSLFSWRDGTGKNTQDERQLRAPKAPIGANIREGQRRGGWSLQRCVCRGEAVQGLSPADAEHQPSPTNLQINRRRLLWCCGGVCHLSEHSTINPLSKCACSCCPFHCSDSSIFINLSVLWAICPAALGSGCLTALRDSNFLVRQPANSRISKFLFNFIFCLN